MLCARVKCAQVSVPKDDRLVCPHGPGPSETQEVLHLRLACMCWAAKGGGGETQCRASLDCAPRRPMKSRTARGCLSGHRAYGWIACDGESRFRPRRGEESGHTPVIRHPASHALAKTRTRGFRILVDHLGKEEITSLHRLVVWHEEGQRRACDAPAQGVSSRADVARQETCD